MKRLKAYALLVLVSAVFMTALIGASGATASADTTKTCSPAIAGSCKGICATHKFLTLVPWYQYLKLEPSQSGIYKYCDVQFTLLPTGTIASSVPLVLLAVLDDLIKIAGLVAVVYVVWGGVKYITSQGSPDGTKQAQNTIINAVVGLVIAVLASSFVSFIGRKIAGG